MFGISILRTSTLRDIEEREPIYVRKDSIIDDSDGYEGRFVGHMTETRKRAYATGAPLRRASRSDGYQFVLWPTNFGWIVSAGCRRFTMGEARDHWIEARGGTDLGDETLDILDMFDAAIRRIDGEPKVVAAAGAG